MRIAAIDRIETSQPAGQLPHEFHLSSKPLSAWTLITISLLAIAALLMPVGMIAVEAMEHPEALSVISKNPWSAVLLATGLCVALVLLAFPLRAGLSRLSGRRTVRLGDGIVSVEDVRVLGTRRWSAPVQEFCGVTHHIRATLSGPRHEIILVHPDRSKDVLLQLASRAPQPGADHYAAMLGVPEIHAKELYGRRRRAPANDDLDLRAAAA